MVNLLSIIDSLSISSTRSCRSMSCFEMVGRVGDRRATNGTKEKIGVVCTGIDQRAPSCPRKDGVVEILRGVGGEI